MAETLYDECLRKLNGVFIKKLPISLVISSLVTVLGLIFGGLYAYSSDTTAVKERLTRTETRIDNTRVSVQEFKSDFKEFKKEQRENNQLVLRYLKAIKEDLP